MTGNVDQSRKMFLRKNVVQNMIKGNFFPNSKFLYSINLSCRMKIFSFRCEHRYKTVEEKSYKEECSEEIRHVCEEKIVYYKPVPKQIPTPQPIFTPRFVPRLHRVNIALITLNYLNRAMKRQEHKLSETQCLC